MKLFKSFVLAGLMAVVAYGVYATIVKGPKTQTAATAPAPLWQGDTPPGPVPLTPGEVVPAPQEILPAGIGEPPEMPAAPPSHDHHGHHEHHGHQGQSPLPSIPGATPAPQATPAVPPTPAVPADTQLTGGEASATVTSPLADAVQPGTTPPATNPNAATQPANDPSVLASPGAQAAQAANVQSAFDSTLLQVNQLLTENRLADAHLHLSRWYASRDQLDAERAQTLLDLLDRLAAKVVYSRESHLDRPHVVQPNETLESIANQYDVPARLLEKINGIQDAASLRPGMELKVVRGPFHVEVQLDRFEMTLFLNDGRYAGRFPIGLGTEVEAKEGEYVVTDKAYDPPYTFVHNNQLSEIPGGNPNNPLGNRLVELGVQAGQQGELAIHGTNNPQTIGTVAREGCIRLKPQDADDIYDILSKNQSKVIIRR